MVKKQIKKSGGVADVFGDAFARLRRKRFVQNGRQDCATTAANIDAIQRNACRKFRRTKTCITARKALKGRWNVPLSLMSGYVDTLLSKIDDPPRVKYGYQGVADMELAQGSGEMGSRVHLSEESVGAQDRQEKKLARSQVWASVRLMLTERGRQVHERVRCHRLSRLRMRADGWTLLQNHTFRVSATFSRRHSSRAVHWNPRNIQPPTGSQASHSFGSRDRRSSTALHGEDRPTSRTRF